MEQDAIKKKQTKNYELKFVAWLLELKEHQCKGPNSKENFKKPPPPQAKKHKS